MGGQLIVAGFHRSGTSLIGQLLQCAGLFLGDKLLEKHPSNPYGHFEDAEVVGLHDQILADNGLSWIVSEPFLPVINESHWRRMRQLIERRNAKHELWGFKDPRVCLFLTVWKHLLPGAKVLLVYRHFSDSTYSLHRRESTLLFSKRGPQPLHRRFWEEPDLALRMWLVHNKALLSFARVYPEDTLAVSFDMIRDGFPVVQAINRRWGLGLDDVPLSDVFDPTVTSQRRGRQPVSDRRLIDPVDATWRDLEGLSERAERMMRGNKVAG